MNNKQISKHLKYLLGGICTLILSCQSSPTVESSTTGPPSFALEGQGKIEIPFDETWKIYLPNEPVAEEHQAIVTAMQKERPSTLTPLFFATKGQFHGQTQYLVNDRPNAKPKNTAPSAKLKAFVYYLKRFAYGNISRAKDLGPMETESAIQGWLLQYQIGNEVYFELIYQVNKVFLRTIISTPLSNYQNLEEFNVARKYIAMLLKGIAHISGKNPKERAGEQTEGEAVENSPPETPKTPKTPKTSSAEPSS